MIYIALSSDGNVGKTTLARFVLKPLLPGARLVEVEQVGVEDPNAQRTLVIRDAVEAGRTAESAPPSALAAWALTPPATRPTRSTKRTPQSVGSACSLSAACRVGASSGVTSGHSACPTRWTPTRRSTRPGPAAGRSPPEAAQPPLKSLQAAKAHSPRSPGAVRAAARSRSSW